MVREIECICFDLEGGVSVSVSVLIWTAVGGRSDNIEGGFRIKIKMAKFKSRIITLWSELELGSVIAFTMGSGLKSKGEDRSRREVLYY